MKSMINAAKIGIPTFGVEITYGPGEPPGPSSGTYVFGNELGIGFSWRIDPETESIRFDMTSVLAEIRDLAVSGLELDTTVFDPPDAPKSGTSSPIDPCDAPCGRREKDLT